MYAASICLLIAGASLYFANRWRTHTPAQVAVTQFRNEDLKSIMQQLGRWYDVEIVYQESVPDRAFTVKISRDKSLAAVLKIMELYGMSFRLEGKKLTVLP